MTPDKYTIQETMLEVGDGHTLYIHEWGNKDASIPVIYLHGGPGGHSKDSYKGSFNPEKQRVIFYDQRGCGKSTPYGSLESNTTAEQIADIEKILEKFGAGQCVLIGGSWGSALAFFFAIAHPERVKAMVLNGIWTGSKSENDWVDKGGFREFFPEAWEAYADSVPKEFHDYPSKYHFPRILGNDNAAAKESAYIYETLEGSAISLDDRHLPESFDEYDASGVRIEIYYISNHCFLPDRYVFDNAQKLTMPIWLIQGRYDMVCPPVTAYELSKILPDAKLYWTISGHRVEREGWNLTRMALNQITGD